MVNLEQIPIVYYILGIIVAVFAIFTYLKNLFGLKIKLNLAGYYIKQFLVVVRLLPRLLKIGYENSSDYEKMINIYFYEPFIKAEHFIPSPHLQFSFYITNRSIFDLKVTKIYAKIINQDNGLEISEINEPKEINLPHQQIIQDRLKCTLHSNFIDQLKPLKKDCKPKNIQLNDVKIFLSGDKEFCKSCGGFNLKIPANEIYVDQ